MSDRHVVLARRQNQALGIGRYVVDFLAGKLGQVDDAVLVRVEQFHADSVACAVAALGCEMRAPKLLRAEALHYPTHDPARGAFCFGSHVNVMPEKAVLANCAAVRELDANGTNFGYDPQRGNMQGEFGHNDFYPVAVAAAAQAGWDGRQLLLAMLCLDEIRGRLAEVFSLRRHKIDHVLHGAVASAAVYAGILGATPEQIESAIGLTAAHYVPFRAIRHGAQLSDSKGAAAALAAEMAVVSARRAISGMVGPADVFRNPQALYCLYEPPEEPGTSPFDLVLGTAGRDFAIMGMHFKLGVYEHQSAGAIQALIDLLEKNPGLLESADSVKKVRVAIYEPAFSIICDPAKRDPQTRQSADHSLFYIVATLIRKALQSGQTDWESLMLMPRDYEEPSLSDPVTRALMRRIELVHGGPEYDTKYPDGLPTSVEIDHANLGTLKSGLVLYPLGHARNTSSELDAVLEEKFDSFASLGVPDARDLRRHLSDLARKPPTQVRRLYDFPLAAQ